MKIYLAAPYSHKDKSIRLKRVEKINKCASKLMLKGEIVFSPITHSHVIATQEKMPTDFDFWSKQDYEFIKWCDAIYILMLPGWDKSKGVLKEIKFAESLNKQVRYISN